MHARIVSTVQFHYTHAHEQPSGSGHVSIAREPSPREHIVESSRSTDFRANDDRERSAEFFSLAAIRTTGAYIIRVSAWNCEPRSLCAAQTRCPFKTFPRDIDTVKTTPARVPERMHYAASRVRIFLPARFFFFSAVLPLDACIITSSEPWNGYVCMRENTGVLFKMVVVVRVWN